MPFNLFNASGKSREWQMLSPFPFPFFTPYLLFEIIYDEKGVGIFYKHFVIALLA